MKKEDYIDKVKSFLGDGEFEIAYVKEYQGELVFHCIDKTLSEKIHIGLPIFVLVNDRGPRFATGDETLILMGKING